MCPGRDCARRNQCYRYRAVPHGEWQRWADLRERHPSDPSISCLNFVYIEGREVMPIDWQEKKEGEVA